VDIHTVSGVLDIDIHVTDPCTVRRPNSFLVTVMSTVWDVTTTVHVQNPVATIHVVLPQTADECNLIVAISAGNSAGMSSPTNITVGCPTTDDSTDPATTTTTANTGRDTNSTDLVDQNQQGDSSIIYIAVGSAIGGAVLVVAVPLIILWKCKRNTSKGRVNSTSGCSITYHTLQSFKPELPFITFQWNLLQKISIQRALHLEDHQSINLTHLQ